jgi:hypothetical protein
MAAHPSVAPALEDLPHPRFGTDQIQREVGVTWYIPVTDQHRDIGGHSFGAGCGGAERARTPDRGSISLLVAGYFPTRFFRMLDLYRGNVLK